MALLFLVSGCALTGACEYGYETPPQYWCHADFEQIDCDENSGVWWPGKSCQELGYTFVVRDSDEWGDETYYADDGDHSTPGANGAYANGHGGNGQDGGSDDPDPETDGGTTTRPKVGAFELIIYPPSGDCANGDDGVAGNFRIYSHCTSDRGATHYDRDFSQFTNFAYWSSAGYWTARFGAEADNPGMIPCENGVPYFNVRIEYSAHPNKSSWPNHCNRSGAADIEFDGQVKQIRLYAP